MIQTNRTRLTDLQLASLVDTLRASEAVQRAYGCARIGLNPGEIVMADLRNAQELPEDRIWHLRFFSEPVLPVIADCLPIDISRSIADAKAAIFEGRHTSAILGLNAALRCRLATTDSDLATTHYLLGHAREASVHPKLARFHLERSLFYQGYTSWREIRLIDASTLLLNTLGRLVEVLIQELSPEAVDVAKLVQNITFNAYGPLSFMRAGAALGIARATSQFLNPSHSIRIASEAFQVADRSLVHDDEFELAWSMTHYAAQLLRLGRPSAEQAALVPKLLEQALTARIATRGEDYPMVANTRVLVAKYQFRIGDRERGHRELAIAKEILNARHLSARVERTEGTRLALERGDFEENATTVNQVELRESSLPLEAIGAIHDIAESSTFSMMPSVSDCRNLFLDVIVPRKLTLVFAVAQKHEEGNNWLNEERQGTSVRKPEWKENDRAAEGEKLTVDEVLQHTDAALLKAILAESGTDVNAQKEAALRAYARLKDIGLTLGRFIHNTSLDTRSSHSSDDDAAQTRSVKPPGQADDSSTANVSIGSVDPLNALRHFASLQHDPLLGGIDALQQLLDRWSGFSFQEKDDMAAFAKILRSICRAFRPRVVVALCGPDNSLGRGGNLYILDDLGGRRFRVVFPDRRASSSGHAYALPALRLVAPPLDKRETHLNQAS